MQCNACICRRQKKLDNCYTTARKHIDRTVRNGIRRETGEMGIMYLIYPSI